MKDEILIPIAVAGLTIVFGLICLMVYLSGGSHFWIKRKLKIGAILLMINSAGVSGQDLNYDTCYLAPAQPTKALYLGISTGITKNYNTGLSKSENELLNNIKINDETSSNFFIGITNEILIGRPEESIQSILTTLSYEANNFTVEKKDGPYPEIYDIGLQDVYYQYSAEYSISYINIDCLFKQNLSLDIPLGIAGGIGFRLPIYNELQERYSISNKEAYIVFPEIEKNQYSKDRKNLILNDGNIKNILPSDIYLKLQIQYEVIPANGFFFIPFVAYAYPLLKVTADSDWRVERLQYGVRFIWAVLY